MLGHTRRLQDRQLARNLMVAAAILALAIRLASGAEERPASSAQSAAGTQAGQAGPDWPGRSEEDKGLSRWLSLPPAYDPGDWSSFGSSAGRDARPNPSFERNDASSSSAGASGGNHLRLGNGYLGIQTKKNVQVLQALKHNDCTTDDECAEYSGLPKTEQPKTSLWNFKAPFLGLSITRPLE